MKELTAKEWLKKGRRLALEITELEEAKKEAFAAATNVGTGYEGNKVQSSNANKSEKKFIQYSNYSLMLSQRIGELLRYQEEMLLTISKVSDCTLRALLTAHYINCKSFEEIAESFGYDVRWVHTLHKRALKEIGEVLNLS